MAKYPGEGALRQWSSSKYAKLEEYFTSPEGDWNSLPIDAGAVTDPVEPPSGYSQRAILFLSNSSGNLTVQTQEPDGDWRDYLTRAVDANILEVIIPNAGFLKMRLTFDTAATVTAWYVFRW